MEREIMNLNSIYDIIDLCKYASIDGETLEIIVSPMDTDQEKRVLSIGLRGGSLADRYSFSFENGKEFESKVLPLLISHFLKGDSLSSWTLQESQEKNTTTKSLLQTKSDNEFLIQTYDSELIPVLREQIEKAPEENEIALTDDEKNCETVLRYLKERFRKRTSFDLLDSQEKETAIALLEEIYHEKKNPSDEELIVLLQEKSNDQNGKIVQKLLDDIEHTNSTLVDQIKDFIRNEQKYNHLMDEEDFIERREVGIFLAKLGYFDRHYQFPRGVDPTMLSSEYFDHTLLENKKSKYNVLMDARTLLLKENKEKEAHIVENFMSYLTKKQQLMGREKKNSVERIAVFPDQPIVIDTINPILESFHLLMNQDKMNSEKLLVRVMTDPIAPSKRNIEISLQGGLSRDRYLYAFEKGEIFDQEILPQIVQMVLQDDKVSKVDSLKKTVPAVTSNHILIETEKGNQCLLDTNVDISTLLPSYQKEHEERKTSVSDENAVPSLNSEIMYRLSPTDRGLYQYFQLRNSLERLNREERFHGSVPNGEAIRRSSEKKIMELAKENEKVAAVERAKDSYRSGNLSFESYQTLKKNYYDNLISSIKKVKKEVLTPNDPRNNTSSKENESLNSTVSHQQEISKEATMADSQSSNTGANPPAPPEQEQQTLSYKERYNRDMTAIRQNLNRVLNEIHHLEVSGIHKENQERYQELLSLRNQYDQAMDLISKRFHKKEGITLTPSANSPVNKAEEENAKASPTIDDMSKLLESQILGQMTESVSKNSYEESKTSSTNLKFEELHSLALQYEPVTDSSLKPFFRDRKTHQKYTPKDDNESKKIAFATYWAAACGLNSTSQDRFWGEKSAFGEEAYELFQIMDVHFEESIKKDVPVDIESLKKQFLHCQHKDASLVFDRLFSDPESVNVMVSYYRDQLAEELEKNISKPLKAVPTKQPTVETTTSKEDIVSETNSREEQTVIETTTSKETTVSENNAPEDEPIEKINPPEVPSGESVISPDLDQYLEEYYKQHYQDRPVNPPPFIQEICDAYEVASGYSSVDKPSSIKIFFPNEEKGRAQITVSYGPTNDEDVLYQKSFDSDIVMNEMLPFICQTFVQNSGIVQNNTFEVPNTNKAGSITLGRNDSLLQMSNATKEDTTLLQNTLKEIKEREPSVSMKK